LPGQTTPSNPGGQSRVQQSDGRVCSFCAEVLIVRRELAPLREQ
jgi:hypothetical protein